MTYKAITNFTDMQDNGYAYNAGDIFPRFGLSVSQERIEELSSSKNRRGTPVIMEVFVAAKNIAQESVSDDTRVYIPSKSENGLREAETAQNEDAEVVVPAKRRRRGRKDG